jgi:hypothetical protein
MSRSGQAFLSGVLLVHETDHVRHRNCLSNLASQQSINGLSYAFAPKVMQRNIDGAFRIGVADDQTIHALPCRRHGRGIGPEQRRREYVVDHADNRGCRLAGAPPEVTTPVGQWGRLPVAGDALIGPNAD